MGCKLTFKDNSLDGLIQFTLNGEVQGEANVGPVSPQMQNELCPIVCVGGHLSFSFVAPDDVCMPKSTLLESDKALVELDEKEFEFNMQVPPSASQAPSP